MNLSNFSDFATGLAREAGNLLARKLGGDLAIAKKGSINLVTEADLESEELIVSRIHAHFPDHAVLAEESGTRDKASKSNRFRWIIDPLDGTTNFAHGYPFFSVSIALEVAGHLQLGVVFNPVARELFSAMRGKGARLNDRPIQVSKESALGESLLCTGFPYERQETLRNLRLFNEFILHARGVRRDGSAALDLCYVAAGRLDGFWEISLNPWDVAAGTLIIQEAGGQVSRFDGSPAQLEVPELLASNSRIHTQMMELIRGVEN